MRSGNKENSQALSNVRENCQVMMQEDFEDQNVKSPTFYNLEVKEFPNHFNTNSRLLDRPMGSSV